MHSLRTVEQIPLLIEQLHAESSIFLIRIASIWASLPKGCPVQLIKPVLFVELLDESLDSSWDNVNVDEDKHINANQDVSKDDQRVGCLDKGRCCHLEDS